MILFSRKTSSSLYFFIISANKAFFFVRFFYNYSVFCSICFRYDSPLICCFSKLERSYQDRVSFDFISFVCTFNFLKVYFSLKTVFSLTFISILFFICWESCNFSIPTYSIIIFASNIFKMWVAAKSYIEF